MIRIKNSRSAFTLVEMLVAMAVTLLMMAALARAFGFVGENVRDSRADVELAGRLVDINARLSDELRRCTVPLVPTTDSDEPLGYFLYAEGPITDATSSLFRVFNDPEGNHVLEDARYGDFDDYIAFTAVAKGNNWFTGKVPRFILDQRTVELLPENNDAITTNDVTYAPSGCPPGHLDPIVIQSKYAEIIYFASPEYDTTSLPGSPAFVDADGNGFPDRLKLHRRVLLIRPDLNLDSGFISARNFGGVNWMRADNWPTATSATVDTATVAETEAWLWGMAGVHQQCDLSLRRVLNSSSGAPTVNVAANSLADLSKPQNRFAHIRIPNSRIGGTGSYPTSMPVLALGNHLPILDTQNSAGTFRIAPPLTPSSGPVVTPNSWSGFLRPEFVLGTDYAHLETTMDSWSRERLGEDVLTNNALAMDVQIYDPGVTLFNTSNDLVLGPNDAGYREALIENIADLAAATPVLRETSQGGFVDLAYPVLAGGSLRGWQGRVRDQRQASPTGTVGTGQAYLVTPFSGVTNYAASATSRNAYASSLYDSGRLVTRANTIHLFQPAFDTYTYSYEIDGILHGAATAGDSGTMFSQNTTAANIDTGSDGLDGNGVNGPDDSAERETQPPFPDRAEAIKVSIRLENPSTRHVRQASVVHRD